MSGSGGHKLKKMAHVGPNMTPMVDVVMCILIFFMLGSSFIMPELFLKSSMPAIDKAGLGTKAATDKMPAVKLWIKMGREGEDTVVSAFDWGKMKMSRAKIKNANGEEEKNKDQTANDGIADLFVKKNASLSPDVQIIILPRANVPWQDVVTIYDFCVQAKFKQVAFAPADDKQ